MNMHIIKGRKELLLLLCDTARHGTGRPERKAKHLFTPPSKIKKELKVLVP
jgi:hypothetical protein